VDLAPGAVLARSGEALDCFYVIREGQVELALPPGHESDVVPLRPGECVGDLALVQDYPQPATATAPFGVRAMRLTRPALKAVLQRFPGALAAVQDAARRGIPALG
jgi:CRP-like cAMP-binding protein